MSTGFRFLAGELAGAATCWGDFPTYTVMGFLADPARGGNRDKVGWKLMGFDDNPAFAPPFGFYDRDYPGWHPPQEK